VLDDHPGRATGDPRADCDIVKQRSAMKRPLELLCIKRVGLSSSGLFITTKQHLSSSIKAATETTFDRSISIEIHIYIASNTLH
jgi:hypothetical protein